MRSARRASAFSTELFRWRLAERLRRGGLIQHAVGAIVATFAKRANCGCTHPRQTRLPARGVSPPSERLSMRTLGSVEARHACDSANAARTRLTASLPCRGLG